MSYNGGITVTIGGTSLENVSSYSVNTHKNDKTDSPVNYLDINITTGVISLTDAQTLLSKSANSVVSVVCPDYNGNMYLTSVSSELVNANIFGKYCRVSLSLTTDPPNKNRITINGLTYDVSSYECSYSYESETFEMYDFSTHYIYKGRRCSISFTTVPLTKTQADGLIAAFNASPISVSTSAGNIRTGDYTGDMSVDSCSKSAVDQGGTTMYTFSVQCTAIALQTGS